MIRLITFDLDDTLWPVRPVIIRAERHMRTHLDRVAPRLNEQLGPDDFARLRGEVLAETPGTRHDLTTLRRLVTERALAEAGYGDAAALAEEAVRVFLDARHDVEYFGAVLDTLEALARRYQLGALSNGNADIARLGLDRYFSFSHSAASVGASKPAPDMFERALQTAGVGPESAVHVGDHPDDDIRGASAVGMRTVWVNHPGERWAENDVTPTWTIGDLAELRDLFETTDAGDD